MKNLEELFAEQCHNQWTAWMIYLYSKSKMNNDGSMTISKESIDHWSKQMRTNYNDLTEKEKESDRIEARKFIEILNLYLDNY